MNLTSRSFSAPGFADWLEVVKTYSACERVLTSRTSSIGLSLAQHDVLAALESSGALRSVDLAQRLFVTKSNVTALLGRMQRDGLVSITPDLEDGRAKRVSATKKGRGLVVRTLEAQQEVVAGMVAQLTTDERQALGDMMRRVRGHLETVAASDAP
ncbi:MarR family winged helix-turn-helix transcriptional regulator [Rubrivirga sp.]|uniref:MarR family winged helix-turn-helix transcriptional regulator n=1 Tax=Rubrivirga sp. TaxID=1885344 RepID=UPI003C74AB9F